MRNSCRTGQKYSPAWSFRLCFFWLAACLPLMTGCFRIHVEYLQHEGSGVVVDALTGAPIPGALVKGTRDSVVTDAAGRFKIKKRTRHEIVGLLAEGWQMTHQWSEVSAKGYQTRSWDGPMKHFDFPIALLPVGCGLKYPEWESSGQQFGPYDNEVFVPALLEEAGGEQKPATSAGAP